MTHAWTIFYGFILGILINIISHLIGVNLTLRKSILVVLFILSLVIIYMAADRTETNLPTGIDKESLNVPSVWNNKGYLNYTKGKYNNAIKCYDEAIKLDPFYSIAWNNKGIALKKLGHLSEANAAFDKASMIEKKKSLNQIT
jgi:tetratricopeptide (TPR) repeat protein